MAKKVHHEEHVDETWLIPYADMLTLLLALFIVMFAMSQVDKAKLQKASAEFNVIFSGGSNALETNSGSMVSLKESSMTSTTSTAMEEDQMNEMKKKLESEIATKGYASNVKVELNEEGLAISIQDVVLFNSGDAKVLEKVAPLLVQISQMIHELDNNIRIAGHTDNVPVKNKSFRSNWDLSAIRAINVMDFMVNSGGLNPQRLSIQAYGEYMPKFDNATPEGRAQNRRVEIFIVRKYPIAKNTTNTTTINPSNTTTINPSN